MEAVGRDAALSNLAVFLADPDSGTYSIECNEGARIDFVADQDGPTITLDLWFFDSDAAADLDTVVIQRADAGAVVDAVFEATTDEAVISCIRALESRTAQDNRR